MLNVEINTKLNRVEIYADSDGLRFLRKKLKQVRKSKKDYTFPAKTTGDAVVGKETTLATELFLCFQTPSNNHAGSPQGSGRTPAPGKGKKKKKNSTT